MTISNIRKLYPHHDFYFFKGKHEMVKSPFFHAVVKKFEVIDEDTIFIYM